MVTVEISAKLTVEDLIAAVEKLPPQELTEFTRRIIAIQSRHGMPLLADDEERALLEVIESRPLSDNDQAHLDNLREMSREGTLTPAEQADLLSFVQQVESQDLVRVEALIELARNRGITISELMQELGIEASYA